MRKGLLILLCSLFAFTGAFGQLPGWSHSARIVVTNTGSAITDYQLKLTVNTAQYVGLGQMLASGNDIRFGKDGCGTTLFPYYIESGMNTANTVIWVKIDAVPSNTNMLVHMFYGNAAAPAASTLGTFDGPYSATNQTVNTNLSGSTNAQRGFRFTANEDILVTALGKYEPNGLPRYVTLFDNATQAILRQEQVAGPTATHSYGNTAPLWLLSGSQYLAEIFFPAGSDAYYFGASPTVNSAITFNDMRYCNGCTQNTFPTNALGGMLYGYVDFQFYKKKTVTPAPTYAIGTLGSGIVASPAGVICSGTSVTFTATATNAGATPVYQWKKNGVPVGTNTDTYTDVALANGDAITCEITNGDPCITPVASNTINMVVNASPTVTGVTNGTVCAGATGQVSATGSVGSIIRWYDAATAGTLLGAGATYTIPNASATDVYFAEAYSAPASLGTPYAGGNNHRGIMFDVTPSKNITVTSFDVATFGPATTYQVYYKTGTYNGFQNTPGAWTLLGTTGSITPLGAAVPTPLNINAALPLTSGQTYGFYVTSTSTATVVSYTNGSGAIASNADLSISGGSGIEYPFSLNYVGRLFNGHIHYMLPDGCASATRTAATLTVTPTATPSVSIVSDATLNTICPGTSVTFTATPVDGGALPVYQWKKNGNPVGTNSVTYTDATLANNDAITVEMTSNIACAPVTPVVSNTVTMIVHPTPTVTAVTDQSVCNGLNTAAITFTGAIGGSVYSWTNNNTAIGLGANGTGNIAAFATTNAGNTTITATVTVTPSANGCTGAAETFDIAVKPTPNVNAISDQSVCAGQNTTTVTISGAVGGTTYNWTNTNASIGLGANGTGNISAFATTNTGNTIQTGTITVTPTANGCPGGTETFDIAVKPVPTITAIADQTLCHGTMTTAVTPSGNIGGTNYAWTNNNTAIGLGANGTGNIAAFSSINTGNAPAIATVTITPSFNGCTGLNETFDIAVNPIPSVNAIADQTVCAGFMTTAINFNGPVAGTSYSWTNNNSSIGLAANGNGNIAAFTAVNPGPLQTSGTITVTPSFAGCPGTAETFTYVVNPTYTPTISLSTVPANNTICAGVAVIFTANHTFGGNNPVFQWTLNGNPIPGNNTAFYTNTGTFNNGDVIAVSMASSLGCVSNPLVTDSRTMTVNPILVPAVTVSPSTPTTICNGTSVTFTATPTNGGSSPVYQWKRNGVNVGTNSNVYTSTVLNNNDVIIVEMTSNALCATYNGVTSSTPINMTVHPVVTPAVSISSSVGVNGCVGVPVTFTATPVNGGSSPVYQWKLNGNNVTGTGNTYVSSSLVTGDVVSCVMTTSAPCATQPTATSGSINMTINPVVVPSVSIAANPGLNICSGTGVVFTATPVNGGSNPTYTWRKNGVVVGSNNPTYNAGTTLANNDVITCTMLSNATCGLPTSVMNTVTMTVTTTLTTAVTMSSSPGNNICAGSAVHFTASTTTGGSTPAYQWRINGNNVGVNSPFYTAATLSNGDIVSVILTSNAPCKTSLTATTNTVMTVTPLVTPTVSIMPSTGTDICTGTPVSFVATITGGGTAPAYQWKKNGVNVGTNSATYNAGTGIVNGDVITCVLTSNVFCASPAAVTSNAVTMNVGVIPSVSISSTHPNYICQGDMVTFTATPVSGGINPAYIWKVNGVDMGITGNTFFTDTLKQGEVVTAQMATSLNCPSNPNSSSNSYVSNVVQPVVSSITVSANPGESVCKDATVTFTAQFVNGGLTPFYQWTRNGMDIGGATGLTFVTTNVSTNDVFACKMQSSLTCAEPVVSNNLVMTVNANMPTSAEIIGIPTEDPSTILFHSNVVNGGSAPVYQWLKNNVKITGANQSTYLGKNLKDNDIISLQVESNEMCAAPAKFSSNMLVMSKVVSVGAVVNVMDELLLFPNPNEGAFTVKGRLSELSADGYALIEVMNAVGQSVYKTKVVLKGTELELPVSLPHAAGMYMLNVAVDGHKQTLRFVIN